MFRSSFKKIISPPLSFPGNFGREASGAAPEVRFPGLADRSPSEAAEDPGSTEHSAPEESQHGQARHTGVPAAHAAYLSVGCT